MFNIIKDISSSWLEMKLSRGWSILGLTYVNPPPQLKVLVGP